MPGGLEDIENLVLIRYHAETIPASPPGDTPMRVVPYVKTIHNFLQYRPIATPRAIYSYFGLDEKECIKNALPYATYATYAFTDGPWKGALVRFGVDPRQDPIYRIYQTLVFSMSFNPIILIEQGSDHTDPANRSFPQFYPKESKQRHLFDGESLDPTSDTWQICDLSDSQLSRIASTTDINPVPSYHAGYFKDATMAKLIVIMQDKLICIRDQWPMHSESEYEVLLSLPDSYQWGKSEKGQRLNMKPEGISKKWQEHLWAKMRRYLYRHACGAATAPDSTAVGSSHSRYT